MRFLADESVEAPVLAGLRAAGHDVVAIAEGRPGVGDAIVLAKATRERRILLTNDKDFAELAFLQKRVSAGIVLIRLPRARGKQKAERILEVVQGQGPRLRNVMTVVQEVALRRRPMPRLP
jgi:predicted nuclease of predicted toxin-antitoxin system